MTEANSEQVEAIQHNGNVILEAGAGSGKTFVLVEHVIFQALQIRDQAASEELQLKILKEHFSKIVLMTFTKKAANELRVRVSERVEGLIDKTKDNLSKFWKLAYESIDFLSITTIHGFCYQLLNDDEICNGKFDIEVTDDLTYQDKLEHLYEDWLLEETFVDKNIFNFFIRSKKEICLSVSKIFQDTNLRSQWSSDKENWLPEIDACFFEDLFRVNNVDSDLKLDFPMGEYAEYNDKPWFRFLEEYGKVTINEIKCLKDFESYLSFFKEFGRYPTAPRKEDLYVVKKELGRIKQKRDFLKKYEDDFLYFLNNKKEYENIFQCFHKMIKSIEDNYSNYEGFSYSDLEYYLLKEFKVKEFCIKVHERYQYFIVDEFQDTSNVQYEILKNLIDNDYDRLFCVGDIKQAIYGFRGGEISIFKKCQEAVKTKLYLKNNYRSYGKVTMFNNYLFEFILNTDLGYEGHSKEVIDYKHQEIPIKDNQYIGEINCYDLIADNDEQKKKLLSNDVNTFEAQAIKQAIFSIKKSHGEVGTIAILYKKLAPSRILLEELLKDSISFCAQVKLPIKDLPLVGIFQVMLEILINRSKEHYLLDHYLEKIDLYFKYLNELSEDLKGKVNLFVESRETLGIFNSYIQFLYSLGTTTGHFELDLHFLKQICSVSKDNEHLIYKKLTINNENKISLDINFGKTPEQLKIMTVHASKGLEFDHVILGGINTNGKSSNIFPYIGNTIGAFKWKLVDAKKRTFKTPHYHLEECIQNKKNFAEAKRLFYVACTRARKSLSWVLTQGLGEKKNDGNCWAEGLQKFLLSDSKAVINRIQCKVCMDNDIPASNIPLFHKNDLGIIHKNNKSNDLFFIPEVSVTRLSVAEVCPRKFYYENVCQLNQEDYSFINDLFDDSNPEIPIEELGVSSKERGIKIHKELELFLKTGKLDFSKNSPELNWIIKCLEKYQDDFESISEKEIKFSFNGMMISGIPDLVLLPKDRSNRNSIKILDFKTGIKNEKRQFGYWMQLYLYAYAYDKLHSFQADNNIELIIAYIDQTQMLSQVISINSIKEKISNLTKKLVNYSKSPSKECSICNYGKICHK